MSRNFVAVRTRGALIAILASAAVALAGANPVQAAHAPCFSLMQWHGWKAPSADVLYLKVKSHEVYEADLSAGSPQLQWSDAHLTSDTHGQDSICSPSDLHLYVSGLGVGGYREPLVVSRLTRLTPEEIAAIPEKYQPH